jgi:phage shock protein A
MPSEIQIQQLENQNKELSQKVLDLNRKLEIANNKIIELNTEKEELLKNVSLIKK